MALASICAAAVLSFASHASAAQPEPRPGRDWAVDPTTPGENLPPVGRSLFDFLVVRSQAGSKVYDVPFPISALMRKLEAELQADASGALPVKAVLIPLGRSLQRTSAAPEFFAHPRLVFAPDAEPRADATHAGMLLKDRVYVGYQEKAELLEIISYNEASGRFEFQLVKDYRPGGTPKVFYANRSVCTACHQNAAPIFPRQLWDETNANRSIAALLIQQKRNFYGVEPERGVDVPYGLDNATDRANLFSTYQLLWREGCEARDGTERSLRCRAALFTAALQYRLSGGQQFDRAAPGVRDDVLPVLARNAREYWPSGLRIPNPDLPNRDPLTLVNATVATGTSRAPTAQRSFAENVNVQAAFDPLVPRPPTDSWHIGEAATLNRLAAGLSEFVAESDARRLSAHLARLAEVRQAPRTTYEADCELKRTPRGPNAFRMDFQCAADGAGRAVLNGRAYIERGKATHGTVDRLVMRSERMPDSEVRDVDIAGGKIVSGPSGFQLTLDLARRATQARRGDGNALETLRIASDQPFRAGEASFRGRAAVTVVNDFEPVRAAIDDMLRANAARALDVFGNAPFRRASLMPALFERLGMKPLTWCCVDATGMPPPAMEVHATPAHARAEADTKPLALQPFFRYCATCHQTNDRSPPNFLQGSASTVAANLSHCAQRLHVRLSMWQVPAEQRSKTPMPPHYALYGFRTTPQVWPDSAELAALKAHVERLLQSEQGKAPRPEELLARGYENLRPCLPDAS